MTAATRTGDVATMRAAIAGRLPVGAVSTWADMGWIERGVGSNEGEVIWTVRVFLTADGVAAAEAMGLTVPIERRYDNPDHLRDRIAGLSARVAKNERLAEQWRLEGRHGWAKPHLDEAAELSLEIAAVRRMLPDGDAS